MMKVFYWIVLFVVSWLVLLVSVFQGSILAWIAGMILSIIVVSYATHKGWINWVAVWTFIVRRKLHIGLLAIFAGLTFVLPILAGVFTRGAPMAFFFLWWIIALLGIWTVVRCLMSNEYASNLVYRLGNWIGRGGFWKFWSTDNLPANSLLVVWLFLAFNTVLYGLPNPGFDRDDVLHQAKVFTNSASGQVSDANLVETTIDSFKGVGNFVTQVLAGKDFFNIGSEVSLPQFEIEELPPLYHKGTWFISWTILTFPLALLGLVFSRRDEAADFLESIVDSIKKERQATSGASSETESSNSPSPVIQAIKKEGVSMIELVQSEVIGKILVDGGASFAKFLRKHR